MTYRLTPRAVDDLEGILGPLSQINPTAAGALAGKLVRRWEIAADYPLSGTSRDDILPGIRHLVIGNYLSFYRIVERDIEIVRVLHARRNLAEEVSDDETTARLSD